MPETVYGDVTELMVEIEQRAMLERAVVEAAINWGTGEDAGSYQKARILQDAVNALYLARQ